MKIALLAYSSNTGLGYQTREFYENIPCEKVLISDLSSFNGMPVDHSWCKTTYRVCNGFPSDEDCQWLVDSVDILFVCETPLNYDLFTRAAIKGVKVVQQFNYEFFDYFGNKYLPKPTVFASPSRWNIERVENLRLGDVQHWPVPIDTKKYTYKKRTKTKTFVHIAGRPASNDRNGTLSFIKAANVLGSDYKFRLFVQKPTDINGLRNYEAIELEIKRAKSNLGNSFEVIENIEDNRLMYEEGDVMVLPRRYGGLCLPMWEALASGMPVVMTNINPNYYSLPLNWLCEATITNSFVTKVSVPVYDAVLNDLILKMLHVQDNIENYSIEAKKLADKMSWDVQKDVYLEKFSKLL